jgi:hypothetical protein
MFAGHRQSFSVMASEPDAKIYINGEYVGDGNVQTLVPRDKNVSVMVKKEGYRTATRSVAITLSGTGIADLIGGWCLLIPFIGFLFPGAHKLQQDNIPVALDKE